MIHAEILKFTSQGTAFGLHVFLGGNGSPSVIVNVSRKKWKELGDDTRPHLAKVWFLFDQPVWVRWLPKEVP